jgi:hypothetical protein
VSGGKTVHSRTCTNGTAEGLDIHVDRSVDASIFVMLYGPPKKRKYGFLPNAGRLHGDLPSENDFFHIVVIPPRIEPLVLHSNFG